MRHGHNVVRVKRTRDETTKDVVDGRRVDAVFSKEVEAAGPEAEAPEAGVPAEGENVDSRGKVQKRQDVLQWDDYFMAIAFLAAKRSKDPSTQVGACIVNSDKRIVGVGYNGFPRGCSDDVLPWDREGDFGDTKYAYVCHAEVNAILNKNSADVKDCTIYAALFPCHECAKMIIQAGITEVAYLSDKYHDTPSMKASRRMLEMAGVRQRQVTPSQSCITIDMTDRSQGSVRPYTD